MKCVPAGNRMFLPTFSVFLLFSQFHVTPSLLPLPTPFLAPFGNSSSTAFPPTPGGSVSLLVCMPFSLSPLMEYFFFSCPKVQNKPHTCLRSWSSKVICTSFESYLCFSQISLPKPHWAGIYWAETKVILTNLNFWSSLSPYIHIYAYVCVYIYILLLSKCLFVVLISIPKPYFPYRMSDVYSEGLVCNPKYPYPRSHEIWLFSFNFFPPHVFYASGNAASGY